MYQITAKFARSTTADAGNGRFVTFGADGVATTTDPWAAGHFAAMPPALGYSVDPNPGPTFTQTEAPKVVPAPVEATRPARRDTLWGDVDRIRRDEEEHGDGPPRFLPELMAERILDRYTAAEVEVITNILLPKRPSKVVDYLLARHPADEVADIANMLAPKPPEPFVEAPVAAERVEAAAVLETAAPPITPTIIEKTAKGQKDKR